jgi:lipoate---protein ligase
MAEAGAFSQMRCLGFLTTSRQSHGPYSDPSRKSEGANEGAANTKMSCDSVGGSRGQILFARGSYYGRRVPSRGDPDRNAAEGQVFHDNIDEWEEGSMPTLTPAMSFAKDVARPRVTCEHRIPEQVPASIPQRSVAEFLARETEFHHLADNTPGAEFLCVWEAAEPAVVLGRSTDASVDVDEESCSRAGVPILRRESGGGTVLLGPGCLNYTLILSLDLRPALRDVNNSYAAILGAVAKAAAVHHSHREGTDLTVGHRKFGGCAQRRRQRTVLHHGTILCGFHIEDAGRFLREPRRQPAYRCGRRHHEFLTNVQIDPSFEAKMREQFPGARWIE